MVMNALLQKRNCKMTLGKFDFNNPKHLNPIIDRVVELWSPPTDDMNFRRLYVEAIIRQNGADNDMQFQLSENGELCSIAFASEKNQHTPWQEWWQEKHDSLPEEFQEMFSVNRSYLSMMDEKTYGYMTDNDVKLSLFVSIKSGWGKPILEEAMNFYRSKGFKTMYLWTDCECNVEWYASRGYELVEEGTFEPFSTPEEPYKTYIFKKSL